MQNAPHRLYRISAYMAVKGKCNRCSVRFLMISLADTFEWHDIRFYRFNLATCVLDWTISVRVFSCEQKNLCINCVTAHWNSCRHSRRFTEILFSTSFAHCLYADKYIEFRCVYARNKMNCSARSLVHHKLLLSYLFSPILRFLFFSLF